MSLKVCVVLTLFSYDCIAAGEDLAELQRSDPEIGCIVRLRTQQENQPPISELLRESEETKILCNQWFRLVVRDGIVYRLLFAKNGEPEVLQLLAPRAVRTAIMRGCHEGMAGGHFGLRRTRDQV